MTDHIHSAYVELTTRCNMRCAHCGVSCGPRGRDMTRATFDRVAGYLRDRRGYDRQWVTLGGGEPTVAPVFRHAVRLMFGEAAAGASTKGGELFVGMVTNGKATAEALWLVAQFRNAVISSAMAERMREESDGFCGVAVSLSQDRWHEPVSPEVVGAFLRLSREFSGEFFSRTNEFNLVRTGRAARLRGLGPPRSWMPADRCLCEALHFDPDGAAWACACRKERLGDVRHPAELDEAISEYGERSGDTLDEDWTCSTRLLKAEARRWKWSKVS